MRSMTNMRSGEWHECVRSYRAPSSWPGSQVWCWRAPAGTELWLHSPAHCTETRSSPLSVPSAPAEETDNTQVWVTDSRVSGSIKLNRLQAQFSFICTGFLQSTLTYLPWLLLCPDPQSCCASSPQQPGFGVSLCQSWIVLHCWSRHAIFQALL